MSIQYCFICEEYIDTDFEAEHFERHEEKKMRFIWTFLKTYPMKIKVECPCGQVEYRELKLGHLFKEEYEDLLLPKLTPREWATYKLLKWGGFKLYYTKKKK